MVAAVTAQRDDDCWKIISDNIQDIAVTLDIAKHYYSNNGLAERMREIRLAASRAEKALKEEYQRQREP